MDITLNFVLYKPKIFRENLNILFLSYSLIGKTSVYSIVSSLFESNYLPFIVTARIVQLVRTLISCIKYENSIFSPGFL